jgi:cytoskeletal protein CcmA (bactofilin family)
MALISRDEMTAIPASTPGSPEMFLGPGARFEGKLTFKGTVRVDTVFKGTITTPDVLLVGERAAVEADLHCGSVIVSGSVTGNIDARTSVELAPSARVRGDIETPALLVQKGAALNGGVTMKTGSERSASVRPPAGGSAGAVAQP